MVTEKTMLRLKEACEFLGISERAMRTLMYKKEIPYYKPFGKLAYFDTNELNEFMHRVRVTPIHEIEAKAHEMTM